MSKLAHGQQKAIYDSYKVKINELEKELETTKKLLVSAIGVIEHYGNRMDSGGTARSFLRELDVEFLAKLSKERGE